MNNSHDNELIFEAYNSNVLKEYNVNTAKRLLGGPASRATRNIEVDVIPPSRTLARTPDVPPQMPKTVDIAATPVKKTNFGKVAAGVGAAAAGAAGLASLDNDNYGAEYRHGLGISKSPAPTPQQGGRAFGASGVPTRPGATGGEDMFKKFHGTAFDQNSAVDRKKMEHIQSLQKAGTPLTAKSVYGPGGTTSKPAATPQGLPPVEVTAKKYPRFGSNRRRTPIEIARGGPPY